MKRTRGEVAAFALTVDRAVVLPSSICFRITRCCNAQCRFCLAPPAGPHPPSETLLQRLDWLLSRGVRRIHFCGGEPTLHPALPQLLSLAHAHKATTLLTTNALELSDSLLSALSATQTRVKVSLHGTQEVHDALVGPGAFQRTTANLARLLAAGIPTSVQSTFVSGGGSVLEWLAQFCLNLGVSRLSILPFIPRGNGKAVRGEFELSPSERRALRQAVTLKRRALSGRLDVRWLDFTKGRYWVLESDGSLVLEGATEEMDQHLFMIPFQVNPLSIPDTPARPSSPSKRS